MATAITETQGRMEALGVVAPIFPSRRSPWHSRSCATWHSLPRSSFQNLGLAGLGPHLTPTLLRDAQRMVRVIGDDEDRRRSIWTLTRPIVASASPRNPRILDRYQRSSGRGCAIAWRRWVTLPWRDSCPTRSRRLAELEHGRLAAARPRCPAELVAEWLTEIDARLREHADPGRAPTDRRIEATIFGILGRASLAGGVAFLSSAGRLLVDQLPETAVRLVLASLERDDSPGSQRRHWRIPVLGRLAMLGYPDEAVSRVQSIDNEAERVRAFEQLAVHLPASGVQAALAVVGLDDDCPSDLVCRLAEQGHAEAALARAQDIRDPARRSTMLRQLAETCPPADRASLQAEALRAAREIDNPEGRAGALVRLIRAASATDRPGLHSETVATIRTIERPEARAGLLIDLAEQLDGPVQANAVVEARQTAHAIADPL